jgi:O-antigen/teichoic acid export membrane protein
MKIERTQNAAKGIVFGTILKIYQIIIPFVIRTIMIYYMGVRYLGLNGLFASILSVLNLAELGVGSAMVYSMYRPIAEDDTQTICALMRLYRTYYRIIGVVVIGIGVAVMPFLSYLVKMETVPEDVNVYVLYLINLGSTVLTYWLFAYKNCLLTACQREDIVSKITLVIQSILYVFQILVVIFLKNFYYYAMIPVLCGVINNLVTAKIVDFMYPNYHPMGKLPDSAINEINRRVKDLFTSKIGGVVYDSADTIVISAFLGLEMLAIYQNYFFIQNSIFGIVGVVFTACSAGIGNSIITESKEKNYTDFKTFTFIICWISGFFATCMLCLYQPFMQLWVGEDLMLPFSVMTSIVIYYFIREINQLLNLYKTVAGIWHQDRWRPLAASVTNLALNIIMVQFWGIYGIIFSTILAILFVGEPWLLHNLFTYVFERKDLKFYLKKLLIYCVVSGLSCVITYLFCSQINLPVLPTLFIRALICCIVPNFIYFLSYRKSLECEKSIDLLNNMTKNKFSKQIFWIKRFMAK